MTVAVNQGVRAAEGARGEIVIVGAWCSRCKREVMPTDGGACPWCQARIVDEDSLSARDLVKQMQSGNGAAPPTDVRGSQPPSKWTRETVIASIQSFAAEHGRTPTQKDAAALVTAAKRLFGSWGDAVVAAGFERPRRGVTNRVDAGVAQPDRAPADQADDAGSTPAPRSEVPEDRQQDAGTESATPPEREPTGQEPPDDDAGATALVPDDRPDSREPTVGTAELASRSDAAADDETGGGARPRDADQRRRGELDHPLRPGSGAVHRGGGEARSAGEGVRDDRRRPPDLAGDERVTDRGEPVFAACRCTPTVLALDCPYHGEQAARLVVEAIDAGRLITAQPPGACELCGKVKETRPYGPNGEDVCFECGMKNEAAAKRQFDSRFGAANSHAQPGDN